MSKFFLVITMGISFLIIGCSKMDDTYKQFKDYGQAKYPGKADSVKILPGKNRMILTWLASADPKVSTAKIYWNNRTDSLEIPIDPSKDSINVPFNNMQEGTYVFEIITFDKDGNKSVTVEAIGKVFGDSYQSKLLARPIYDATVINDSLNILWGGLSDTAIIGTQLTYKDNDSIIRSVFVDKSILLSQLPKFSRGNIQYRTVYLPNKLAIDTFYTPWVTRYVKGQRYPLPKNGWIATASSFDTRTGSSFRPPSYAIDNNLATIWVNQIVPQTYYPHWISVDMGSVKTGVEGFAIAQRNSNTNLVKDIELYISMDGINWELVKTYTLEQIISVLQYIEIPVPRDFRYFKVIAKNDYGNSNNVALAEVGVYSR